MFRNYTATLDNITMSKHLFFYGFLLLRWRSGVGCLLFTAWHTNCNTKLVRSSLLVKMFLRDDYLRKHCFQQKWRSSEQFQHRLVLTKSVCVTSELSLFHVFIWCLLRLPNVARIIADYLFRYFEAEAFRYINRFIIKSIFIACVQKNVFFSLEKRQDFIQFQVVLNKCRAI